MDPGCSEKRGKKWDECNCLFQILNLDKATLDNSRRKKALELIEEKRNARSHLAESEEPNQLAIKLIGDAANVLNMVYGLKARQKTETGRAILEFVHDCQLMNKVIKHCQGILDNMWDWTKDQDDKLGDKRKSRSSKSRLDSSSAHSTSSSSSSSILKYFKPQTTDQRIPPINILKSCQSFRNDKHEKSGLVGSSSFNINNSRQYFANSGNHSENPSIISNKKRVIQEDDELIIYDASIIQRNRRVILHVYSKIRSTHDTMLLIGMMTSYRPLLAKYLYKLQRHDHTKYNMIHRFSVDTANIILLASEGARYSGN